MKRLIHKQCCFKVYYGNPSRALSTMSLSVRPVRRLTSRPISRSQSFTGVNTYDKHYRNLSVLSTAGLSRKPNRASRMFTMSTKSNPPLKIPQPERLDQVYEALKKGLQSYLHVHQMDLDSLSRQMKESKRNSRLTLNLYGICIFLHLSQIDELYEAYCLQRRLRDGANKMVKAYTSSTGSKEARESLAEANKGYKEYTENMCVLESDLENQLGEFHIKMKGKNETSLIFMKYGRQRWKLRGRIEINAKQVWDTEEMVFLPLISEFLSVKVTELKSLANHVVVGSVSCETKDLFAALPQMVAVDINDLGTIKLSLEVTWNPFDKDDQGSVASTVNKAPTVNKRFSTIFNQSPPDTPSLREQAFYNMLRRHEELENGTAWSNSSESSDDSSSPQLSVGGLHNSTQHKIQPAVTGSTSPQPNISFCLRDSFFSTSNSTYKVNSGSEDDSGKQSPIATDDGVANNNHISHSYLRSLSHISESSTDGTVLTDRSIGESGEVMSLASGISINDIVMEMPSRTPEPPSSTATDTDMSPKRLNVIKENTQDFTDQNQARKKHDALSSVPTCSSSSTAASESGDVMYIAQRVPVVEEISDSIAGGLPREDDGPVDRGLEDALRALVSSLGDYRGQFPELQLLEQELKLLQVTLKVRRKVGSPSKPSICWDSPSIPASPLTSGCTTLDCSLVVHLQNCSAQLLHLGMFGPLRCREMYALDKLQREGQVFKIIRGLIKNNPRRPRQPAEVIPDLGPCLGAVSLWQQCVGQGSVYSVSAESFLTTLSTTYSTILPERANSIANTVFLCLLERVLDQRLPRRGSNRDRMMVTLFQLWSYIDGNSISDMETHITDLAEEVWLVQRLASCDQDIIVHTLRRSAECSLSREGLHTVAKLLKDPRGKVSASASSALRCLAAQPRQREQALVSCLELLEDENVDTRVCGCKALACLKAKESIDQLVYLCRTDKEEVRDAAKQALLVLGEEGKMAHRHVETSLDSIPRLFAPGSMASTAF
uniref:RHO family interacting cell polarization regulator 1 n=1 Tax=Mastacembelus armatus TaxID=205130 RepID=A0A7N8XDC7_9TELE